MMRKVNILKVLSIISIVFLHSCSGCSKSGRDRLKRERSNSPVVSNNDRKERDNNRNGETVIKEPERATTPSNSSSQESVQELFKKLEKGVVQVYALDNDGSGATGSGFFVSSKGIGVTNYHVLSGHDYYEIKTSDGEYYEIVDILAKSPPEDLDYVIFQVESQGKNFVSVPMSNIKSEIGEDVFAIGSPLGYENSLTKGSVSQYRENDRIQIDATIDHGSSGGPLFNMKGEVIGITSSGVEGVAINFAVDIKAIQYLKRF